MKHALLLLAAMASMQANALDATVHLDGDWYLQAGEVTNYRAENLTRVVYDLGYPDSGVAVWQTMPTTGSRSNPYGADYYTTHTWATSVSAGQVWWFDGLDMDVSTGTGDVDSSIDFTGASLRRATVSLSWADGWTLSQPLAQTSWVQDQTLSFGMALPVPEPATDALLVAGLALLGCSLRRSS